MDTWTALNTHNARHSVAYCDECGESLNYDPGDADTYRISPAVGLQVLCRQCLHWCDAEPHLEECEISRISRFVCGVPDCLTWQEGFTDDLMDLWLASAITQDGREVFYVCPEHQVIDGPDGPMLKAVISS